MTLNFIDIEDLEESVDNLAELPDLREIYFLGNPCTDWVHWKDYMVARIPSLGRIDGDEITKTWKMQAKQKLNEIQNDLP
jgi:protein TilB